MFSLPDRLVSGLMYGCCGVGTSYRNLEIESAQKASAIQLRYQQEVSKIPIWSCLGSY